MKKKRSGRIGSSLDDFLKETGIYEEVTARAIKRVIARQLDALMQDQGLTKSALAKRMHTSRAQLDRLLDPENESVTLGVARGGPTRSNNDRSKAISSRRRISSRSRFHSMSGGTPLSPP